ncbi:GNAT family N-acetyltransferase [Microlunatus lacustris]
MTGYQVQREDDFDFLSAEYEELCRRAAGTPFQAGTWLSTLYEVLAPRRRAQKLVITVRARDGRLVLVLPLVRRRQGPLRLIEYADLGVNDYAALVVDGDELQALTSDVSVIRQIRAALGRFDLLRIERVPDRPELFLAVLVGSRARQHSYGAHLIELPGTVEDWHAGLDPQFTRHLERKRKRLRPKGSRRLRDVTDPLEIDAVMARLRRFRADRFASRRGVDLVQHPDYYAFYCAAAKATTRSGAGRLVVLEVAEEVVAVSFDLTDSTSELFLLVGYDVGRLRNYSLGLLIVDELVQGAIRRALGSFDLTVGDEPYKADFGAQPRPLFEIRLSRTPLGAAGVLGRDVYLRARRTAKEVLMTWENHQRRRAVTEPARPSASADL